MTVKNEINTKCFCRRHPSRQRSVTRYYHRFYWQFFRVDVMSVTIVDLHTHVDNVHMELRGSGCTDNIIILLNDHKLSTPIQIGISLKYYFANCFHWNISYFLRERTTPGGNFEDRHIYFFSRDTVKRLPIFAKYKHPSMLFIDFFMRN